MTLEMMIVMVCRNILTIVSSKENSGFTRIESCKHLLTNLTCQYLSYIVKVKVITTTVSRPVCLETEHPFGAYDQILIIF
jgi:hypothetical protein